MSEGLNQFLNATGKAIETVPKLYDDALQPAMQETGKLLARIPHAINAALSVCDQWILNREYNVDATKKLLAQKLKDVPVEKIISPEPYVAVPALQAISYSMNNEELRNLYANLLSKAMNIDTKESVHPCFVDIIKQMSPLDAKVIQSIMSREVAPIIHINIKVNKSGGNIPLVNNISWMNFAPYKMISVSINNLYRLGLIDLPSEISYSTKSNYDCIKNNPQFLSLVETNKLQIDNEKHSIELKEAVINQTDLGILFNQICILPIN
jgi:abortive infection alpha-like protein